MNDEPIQIINASGTSAGICPRHVVHRRGLRHRSTNVFVFSTGNALLLQQRSANKSVYPNRWDLSVAEHARPFEAPVETARRGLEEEIGVTLDADSFSTVQRGFEATLVLPARGGREAIIDREVTTSFRCTHDGPFVLDPNEVSSTRWVDHGELTGIIETEPRGLTPWLLQRLRSIGVETLFSD